MYQIIFFFTKMHFVTIYFCLESPIAKISIEVEDTTVENLMKSWSLNPSDLTEIGFPFERFKNANINGFIKGD